MCDMVRDTTITNERTRSFAECSRDMNCIETTPRGRRAYGCHAVRPVARVDGARR